MEVPSIFFKYRDALEQQLKRTLEGRTLPLYNMMRYHMGWIDESGAPVESVSGKRLRPTLCLMCSEGAGGDYPQALPAAAAVELIHNFSLIHDDIQDGSPQRRNRPAVWWLWGPSQGINAGDGMYAVATLALLRLRELGVSAEKVLETAQLLETASLRLCEGQYLDITFQDKTDVSLDAYMSMISAKTAALISCACEIGALIGSNNASLRQAFAAFGQKLGLAFQIRDDVLDLWGEKEATHPPSVDITHRKKTFPVVYVMERAPEHLRAQLVNLYRKRTLTDEEVGQVVSLLDEMNAKEFAQQRARQLRDEALSALETAHIAGPLLNDFRQVAFYLTESTTQAEVGH